MQSLYYHGSYILIKEAVWRDKKNIISVAAIFLKKIKWGDSKRMKAVTVLWRLVRRDFFDKVISEHRLESNIKLFNYERCCPDNTGFLLTLWYVSMQNGDDLGLGLANTYPS